MANEMVFMLCGLCFIAGLVIGFAIVALTKN